MSITTSNNRAQYQKLKKFLETWPLSRIRNLTLEEYSNVGNKNTFCYWLEFGSGELGLIGGKPLNKFGIWNRKTDKQIVSVDFLYNDEYAWYKKYGNTQQKAFETVRSHIISIIESAQSGNFKAIDGIDLDSLSRWKIAFIYSNYRLLPIYKNVIVRTIAKHFDHSNYRKARLSDLHTYIINKKPPEEDFFDFAYKYYRIAVQELKAVQESRKNYYIIGSKYEDENGNDNVDKFPAMLKKSAISTGFFWNYDFTHLVGHAYDEIHKWIDKNIPHTEPKFDSAKRTLGYFLNLKHGDIVAVKSHGRYGNLTIIAYAQVKEVDGRFYKSEFGDDDLGHLIYVDFLETGLNIQTGLSYGQTIHKIVPGEKAGHFEKIFGSYAFSETDDNTVNDEEDTNDDLKEKDTSAYKRSASSEQIVTQIHNKIQNEFSKYLKCKFPNDTVKVEKQDIDVWRKSKTKVFFYEIKPYNSAYYCIRDGIGQLLDYSFSNSSKLNKWLIIVGIAKPSANAVKFINFIKSSLSLNFNYEYFDMRDKTSKLY